MSASDTNYLSMDLLRFTTAGSVDDGKSTLIGRLLYDSKAIFEDQLDAIERATEQRGEEHLNLSLLTDGLSANKASRLTWPIAISRHRNASSSSPIRQAIFSTRAIW
jgi:sulfate adenylyltransferase subunit 1